jgi:hypothetical protein
MKLPPDVQFYEDIRLLVWKSHGVLNEAALKHTRELIGDLEATSDEPLNRFSDLSALDAVDLNFDFVFHVALGRRLSAVPRPAVKSAFYVATPASTHYVKLHAMLTDYSPLHVALFTDRATAANWLGVPLQALSE